MTVTELSQKLNFEIVCGKAGGGKTVECVYSCDLLSLVISRAKAGAAWVTVIGNVNTVATAVLADLPCIILAEGTKPDAQMLTRADLEGVPVLASTLPVFETCLEVSRLL